MIYSETLFKILRPFYYVLSEGWQIPPRKCAWQQLREFFWEPIRATEKTERFRVQGFGFRFRV